MAIEIVDFSIKNGWIFPWQYVSSPEGSGLYEWFIYVYMYIWLVAWNINLMTFHSAGNVIIPTDFHIFQRDWHHQPVYVLSG